MIRGVHHVSFSTRNLDGMLSFYRDFLGLAVVADTPIKDIPLFDKVVGLRDVRARGIMLQAGNAFIEFWQYEQPQGKKPIADRPACDAGLTHVCFDIADAQATYEKLLAAGGQFESPPQHLGSVITFYARDPDGNLVELRQGLPPVSKIEVDPEIVAISQSILGR